MEMVCSYDRWTCRHVRFGVQSRRSEIQGGARAVSPAMRQRLALSQVADGAVRFRRAVLSPVQGHRNIGVVERLRDEPAAVVPSGGSHDGLRTTPALAVAR